MPRKPSNLIYGVDDKPPLVTNLLLGFQHIFVLSIAFIFPVVIINEIGGPPEDAQNLICMAMLATGLSTILQSVNRGPVGSGYFCPLVNGPAFIPASIMAAKAGGLSLIFGMTIVAGIFEALFSRVVGRLRSLFPPEVTGTVVLMVGIEVIPIAVPKFFGVDQAHPQIDVLSFLVALFTLAAMASLNVWGKGKLKLYSLLIGMALGYAASLATGILSIEQARIVFESPFFQLPQPAKFGISFQPVFVVPFVVAALSSALKTMGDLTTCQKINDADWRRIEMPSISRGILACASGNVASGLLGALGQSVSSSNIGLSIATGATSRTIGYAAGGILILLAFLPQVAAIFVIMPTPVMGSALVFAVCFMILAGLQIITSRMLDARKTFVVGLSVIFGLSFDSIPGLYAGVDPMIRPLVSSSLAIATISAVVLNMFFRLGIAKKANLIVVTGKDSSDTIFEFMDRQGAAWGARKEVITPATSAMNELLEAVYALGLEGKEVRYSVQFDEFNLDVEAVYQGPPFEIPSSLPSVDLMRDFQDASLHMAAFTLGRYSDKISFTTSGECTEIRMHFDH